MVEGTCKSNIYLSRSMKLPAFKSYTVLYLPLSSLSSSVHCVITFDIANPAPLHPPPLPPPPPPHPPPFLSYCHRCCHDCKRHYEHPPPSYRNLTHSRRSRLPIDTLLITVISSSSNHNCHQCHLNFYRNCLALSLSCKLLLSLSFVISFHIIVIIFVRTIIAIIVFPMLSSL